MRTLLFLVLTAALGWSAYWWVGSTAKHNAIDGWLAAQRQRGWVAESADMLVTGYPNRFDTIIRDLNLADPSSGWSWSAPAFQILALSYQPNHIIAVWPEIQTVASPLQTIRITSNRMRGSVRFAPDTKLALRQMIVELDSINALSSLGWHAGLAEGQLAIRRSAPGAAPDFGYDVSLTGRSLRLPEPLRAQLDPTGVLPPTLANADLRLTPVYSAPWDRIAVETGAPDLVTLNVGNASVSWGAMELTVTGRLDADPEGYAEGRLNVIARNWQDMLDMGVRSGLVPADYAGSLESALKLLAQMTGQTDRLDVTINFRDGLARVGPVPIGTAPLLHR